MQVVIIAALVAVSCASPLIQAGGTSATYSASDNVGNYNFGYDESHATGGTFRRESGSKNVKVGSYGLIDADGRRRIVSYVANENGFFPTIHSNEHGVDGTKDPASTSINGSPLAYASGASPVWSYAHPAVSPVSGPVAYNSVVQHNPLYSYAYRF